MKEYWRKVWRRRAAAVVASGLLMFALTAFRGILSAGYSFLESIGVAQLPPEAVWRPLVDATPHWQTPAPRDARWQPVPGTRLSLYVYSAFVESRTEHAVRVIAASGRQRPAAVLCHLWLRDNRTITTSATVKIIRENNDQDYSAAFVLCSLDHSLPASGAAGATVTVFARAARTLAPSNALLVHDTAPQPNVQDEIHVCVRPIHANYSRHAWLVEWLEMNRLLGVSHVYLYNHSMSGRVGCILEH